MKSTCLLSLFFVSLYGSGSAAGLKQAEFTRVINDVRVMPIQQQPIPAKLGDKISGQTGVSTGASSRAELTFPDKTITRIGANSLFKLDKSERTVDLEKGVILLQVPKQIGGAKVRTAAVTAAVTGTTVMVEYAPDGAIKIIVLEGEVDVYLNDKPSVMRTLVAGDMLILPPDATSIPLPVKVDLELLKKTSKLMDIAEFGPLGNQKYLTDALKEQQTDKDKGELLKTAFEIMGRGTQVTLTNEARHEIAKNFVVQNRPGTTGGSSGSSGGNNNNATGGSTQNSQQSDAATAPTTNTSLPTKPIVNAGRSIFGSGSSIVTNPHATAFNSTAGGVVTMQGTIYRPSRDGVLNTYLYDQLQTTATIDDFIASRGDWFTFLGENVRIAGNISTNTAPGPRNIIIASQNSLLLDPVGADLGATVQNFWNIPSNVDSLVFAANGSIVHSRDFELNALGSGLTLAYYALGSRSDVLITGYSSEGGITQLNLPFDTADSTFMAIAGRDVVISEIDINATNHIIEAGNDIRVTNASLRGDKKIAIKAVRGVNITSTNLIRALVESASPLDVMIAAMNGNVDLNSVTIDGRSVDISSEKGNLNLNYVSIYNDIIKARVHSTGGELLINGSVLGNSFVPASVVKLYGEGANGVRFSGYNEIHSLSTDIAGNSVTIDSSGEVRLSHPANTRVFTDHANFNNGSYGSFKDLGGTPTAVSKNSYSGRPGY